MTVISAPPLRAKGWNASEEHAVVLGAELREVGVCGRRVGFEVEAVPCFLGRSGGDGNRRGALEEVAAEPVRRIAESQHAPGHAAPFDCHRIDNGTENPKRMLGIEAVGNGEDVKHGADIVNAQPRGPAVNVHFPTTYGERSAPEDERAGHNPRVIRVEAQRAPIGGCGSHPQAVQSYESDAAAVPLIVEADEDTIHEAHVGVEVVGGARAGVEVRAGTREIQIGLAEHPTEVRDDRWVVARNGASGRTGVNWPGEEEVSRASNVRDGPRNCLAPVALPFIFVIGKCRQPQSRAKQESSSGRGARRSTNEIAPTQPFLLKLFP